ncbi:MAG: hypothetical protein Kow0069_13410 [Promethearchaeota archaeon]
MRGQVCPIPAAETRKALRAAAPGTVVEVVGDFAEAAENVRNIALNNGAEVLSVETGHNHFKVVVKKRPE